MKEDEVGLSCDALKINVASPSSANVSVSGKKMLFGTQNIIFLNEFCQIMIQNPLDRTLGTVYGFGCTFVPGQLPARHFATLSPILNKNIGIT